jgi:magnesium chelatase subunit I
VRTPDDLKTRIEIVRRRDAYERDPDAFLAKWKRKQGQQRSALVKARERLGSITVSDKVMEACARLCIAVGSDGLRGELTLIRAGRALAALEGAKSVTKEHLKRLAPLALSHRLRRDPLDDSGSSVRIERAVAETL